MVLTTKSAAITLYKYILHVIDILQQTVFMCMNIYIP